MSPEAAPHPWSRGPSRSPPPEREVAAMWWEELAAWEQAPQPVEPAVAAPVVRAEQAVAPGEEPGSLQVPEGEPAQLHMYSVRLCPSTKPAPTPKPLPRQLFFGASDDLPVLARQTLRRAIPRTLPYLGRIVRFPCSRALRSFPNRTQFEGKASTRRLFEASPVSKKSMRSNGRRVS